MKQIVAIILLMMASFQMSAQQTSPVQHDWRGRRVAYFGDSITDPNVKTTQKRYWELLADWLNITSYCYAVSGRQWDDIPRQTQKLKEDHNDDFDAIIIFMGTNDFNAAVPIGEWWTEGEAEVEAAVHGPKQLVKRIRRTPNLDPKTYKGRINIALQNLKKTYPTKQIVLLTPIHRAFATFGEQNVQPDESYQNAIGEWFSTYVDVIKEAGNIWAIPVIDINSLSGLYPLLPEHHQFFGNPQTDQLHPNDAGHFRLARTLYYQLSTIPCVF